MPGPGRSLEASSDASPRGMAVHDRTRLIGRLTFFSLIPSVKAPGRESHVARGLKLGPEFALFCVNRSKHLNFLTTL